MSDSYKFAGTVLTASIVLVVFFSGACVAGDLWTELGLNLSSVKIVDIDEVGAVVSYVPGKILLTDPNGSEKPFMVLKAGEQLVLSANASIVASDLDVAELQCRVNARLGSGSRLIAVRPEAFSLEIDVAGREALRRQLAGGALSGVPVQVMMTAPSENSPIAVSARAKLTYSKQVGARQRSRTLVLRDGGATASVELSSDAVSVGYSESSRQETIRESTDSRSRGGDSVTLISTFSFVP